jgi:putative flippase GtrA
VKKILKFPKTISEALKHPVVPYLFRGGKFMIVAWIGMLVNTGCLYLFKGVLGIRLIPASLMAIEIAIIHNFIWLRFWAWGDRGADNGRRPFFKQLLLYNAATGTVDLAANVTILWVLAAVVGVHYLIANVMAQLLGPFIKFWLNEKIIFKETR